MILVHVILVALLAGVAAALAWVGAPLWVEYPTMAYLGLIAGFAEVLTCAALSDAR